MEIIFFRNLAKLINKYLNNPQPNTNAYTDLMMIFVDLYYSVEELNFISHNLQYNFELFIEFVSMLAFKKNINFNTLTYITDEELYQLDSIIFEHNEVVYDDNLKYKLFKEIISKNKKK